MMSPTDLEMVRLANGISQGLTISIETLEEVKKTFNKHNFAARRALEFLRRELELRKKVVLDEIKIPGDKDDNAGS